MHMYCSRWRDEMEEKRSVFLGQENGDDFNAFTPLHHHCGGIPYPYSYSKVGYSHLDVSKYQRVTT